MLNKEINKTARTKKHFDKEQTGSRVNYTTITVPSPMSLKSILSILFIEEQKNALRMFSPKAWCTKKPFGYRVAHHGYLLTSFPGLFGPLCAKLCNIRPGETIKTITENLISY